MQVKQYNRKKAIEYAHKWAYLRNPQYYNFDSIGGDCTNFISQCIYSANNVMNYNELGWYYKTTNNKSASWTGVEFLHKFLINNKSIGPFGKEAQIEDLELGDIVQLSFDKEEFSHSLIIVDIKGNSNRKLSDILIASHTFDSDYRKVSTYNFSKIRFIHIIGIRTN